MDSETVSVAPENSLDNSFVPEESKEMADIPNAIVADHPLLDRFQKALFDHLTRVVSQVENEITEIDGKTNELNEQREEIGSHLYDLQHEIERQKDILDLQNTRIAETFEKRTKCENENRKFKQELKKEQENLRNLKRMHSDRMVELNKLQLVEQNVSKWQQEMQNDIKVSKRMLSKDKQSKKRITEEKQQMDLLLLNLEMEVRHREEESTLVLSQIQEQEKQLEVMKMKMANANADLDALQGEHRRLINSWNDVIYAISNRDKLLARTNEKLNEENENIKIIQTNIEGTKKEALKQMERNENLEQFKQRLSGDLSHLNRQYDKAAREHSGLIGKMDKLSALLSETETALSKANVENHILEGNLKSQLRDHECQVNNKTKQENLILELLQGQVTTDQASKIRGRNIFDIQNKRRELEIIMSSTEAKLSEILFELEKLKGIVTRSKIHADDLLKDKLIVEQKSKEYDKELKTVQKTIESKLSLQDRLNKQISKLIEEAGGSEKDPMEVKIYDYEKTITELEVEIKDDQNQWLRHQNNIVQMSEKLNHQLNEIHLARKQLLIIEQKTIKVDNEINEMKSQDHNIGRDIKNLNTKLDVLSTKVFERKQNNQTEKEQSEFMHADMMNRLRRDELAVIQLEDELKVITDEITDLKRAVLDKHREALSWETKWKMVAEAKRERDAEFSKASEIGAMKSEIHRMEVRYNQLKRAQEKLVSDMEHCVQHRDRVFDDASIRSKLNVKSKTTDTMQYRVSELRKKLRQIYNEISLIEKQLASSMTDKECIEMELTKLNQTLDDERTQYALLQNEIEQAILLKQENLDSIVRLQHRAKRYRGISTATQVPKNRNETAVDIHTDRHTEINEHLICVLEKLRVEFPDQKFAIQRILQTLKA